MNDALIASIISDITKRIEAKVDTKEMVFNKQGLATQSEQAVYKATGELVDEGGIPPCKTIIYDANSHQFPDIVIEFNSGYLLGIEVKSSSSINNSWSINGNSVLGSTSVKVDDIYIIFIKSNPTYGFAIKYARYQDSIADVIVTHSPRYKIDLNIDPKKSFFYRSGISYEAIKTSENPIALITDYFRSEGKTAWWLGDSNDDTSTSATILSWYDMDKSLIERVYGEAFVLFPEIINGSSRHKYSRLAKWLVAKYSIADSSLRDKFSAGGKVTLTYEVNGKQIVLRDVSKVYATLTDHKASVDIAFTQLSLMELQEFWTSYRPKNDNAESRKRHWFSLLKVNANHQDFLTYIATLFKINIP